jgi:hypothetical protein
MSGVPLGTPEAANDRVRHLLWINRVIIALDALAELLHLHHP